MMQRSVSRMLAVAALVIASGIGSVSANRPVRFSGTFQAETRPIPLSLDSLRSAGAHEASLPRPKLVRLAVLADATLSDAALRRYGWRLIGRVGDVATVEGPASSAPYLGALRGVRYVTQPPPRIHTVMDSARRCCFIDQIQKNKPGWNGPRLTGKKVLFGIIDSDFDTRHKAFRDSLGKTRFVALWDQMDSTKKYSSKLFGYGSIANHSQLLADTAFGLSKGFHGTCMTSYAAGGRYDTNCPYYGVAPDAAIAGVKMGETDQTIIDGLNWLFHIADSMQLPCVVNMSLGSSEGPHDGSSLVDRAIDTLSKKQGHIVVGAAGNDGARKTHVTLALGKGQAGGTWAMPVTSGGYQYYELDMWGQTGKSFIATLCLLDTASMSFQTSMPTYSTSSVPADSVRSYQQQRIVWTDATTKKRDTAFLQVIALESASALNGKPHLRVAAASNVPGLCFGVKDSAAAAADTIQAWNGYGVALRGFQMTGFLDGDDVMSVNELGGTARHNITVGGYYDKLSATLWNGMPMPGSFDDQGFHTLTSFSGHGPTADGRVKPDITAPAANVVGAMARDIDSTFVNVIYWPNHPATDGRYAITGGTSCSSPIVAGIVAMMLQADPTLTADSVKRILQASALNDAATGTITSPSNLWGAGKVSALGALSKQLNISATRRLAAGRASTSRIALLSGDRVRLSSLRKDAKACFEYYTIQGRCVRRRELPTGQAVDCYAALPAGVYFLRVKAGEATVGAETIVKKE